MTSKFAKIGSKTVVVSPSMAAIPFSVTFKLAYTPCVLSNFAVLITRSMYPAAAVCLMNPLHHSLDSPAGLNYALFSENLSTVSAFIQTVCPPLIHSAILVSPLFPNSSIAFTKSFSSRHLSSVSNAPFLQTSQHSSM